MELQSSWPLPGAIALHTSKKVFTSLLYNIQLFRFAQVVQGGFQWEIRGSRLVPCAARFAIVSIAVLYIWTVSVAKGVGGGSASVPGVQPGVEGIF